MKAGRPLRVESRRAGVSIGFEQLSMWRIPALALPLLHVCTANFIDFPMWKDNPFCRIEFNISNFSSSLCPTVRLRGEFKGASMEIN